METMSRNTIFQFVKEHYETEPEYLWAKSPEHAVLRNGQNNKWFAIVMNVAREKLGLSGSGKVEIMNVKCDPLMISVLVKTKGFLPAYHMNKENWITILLDGSVTKEEIFNLLSISYNLVKSK